MTNTEATGVLGETVDDQRASLVRRRCHLKARDTAFKKFVEAWDPREGVRTLQLRLAKTEEIWNLFDKIQDAFTGLEDDHVLNSDDEAFENTYFEVCSRAYDLV